MTIRGGPPQRVPRAATWCAPPGLLPLLLLVLALVLAAVPGESPALPAPPPVDATLRAYAAGVPVWQGEVLLVPVELQDLGRGHRVVSARAYAGPVRSDPVVDAPDAVPPGAARRFVVLLAPDCRLLRRGSGVEFGASVLVRVVHGGASQQLALDLADRTVQARVAGLCRSG